MSAPLQTWAQWWAKLPAEEVVPRIFGAHAENNQRFAYAQHGFAAWVLARIHAGEASELEAVCAAVVDKAVIPGTSIGVAWCFLDMMAAILCSYGIDLPSRPALIAMLGREPYYPSDVAKEQAHAPA